MSSQLRARRVDPGLRSCGSALAIVVLALAGAGCGSLPPQPPAAAARKLDWATSAIADACGKAYELRAFAGEHGAALRPLERSATRAAGRLAQVFRRGPRWHYQGYTVAQIVGQAIAMLRACGLRPAAAELARATSPPGATSRPAS